MRKFKEAIGISKCDALIFAPSEAASHEDNVAALKDSLGKSYLFAINLNQSLRHESNYVLFLSKTAERRQSENLLNLKSIGAEHLKQYVEKSQKLNNYA